MRQNNLLQDDAAKPFQQFKKGDGDAFKLFYDLYFDRLYQTIHLFVGQRELAEDIMANAFLKLYKKRMDIREAKDIYRFLFVVARNEAIEHLKGKKRRLAASEDQGWLAEKKYEDSKEEELSKALSMEKINQLIEQLPPARKKIFRLTYFEGQSIREIASRLNLTETTVRNQRNRALLFLREALITKKFCS